MGIGGGCGIGGTSGTFNIWCSGSQAGNPSLHDNSCRLIFPAASMVRTSSSAKGPRCSPFDVRYMDMALNRGVEIDFLLEQPHWNATNDNGDEKSQAPAEEREPESNTDQD